MAEFSKLVITNKGQALLAKMIAGSGNIEFTKISASSTAYTDAQLEGLTSLTNVKQTSLISKVTRTNEVAIKVEAAFTNTELTAGYYMKALGLYAVDPDAGEILYAVTRETSGNCYMPAYNGITVSGAYVQLVTTIGNAENVSLEVDQAAVATIGDIQELQKQIADLEAFIGYSADDIYGVEVDFANKKFTRLSGAVNRTPGEGFDSINAFGGRKRCNVADDGTVTAYYGDANYTTTGKNAAGTKVQVMVEQPKFYYKVVPMVLEKGAKGMKIRKARYYVSDTLKPGFKVHPAFVENGNVNPYIYLAAFEGSLFDTSANAYILDDAQVADFAADVLCSIANAKPASGLQQNLTRANTRKLAQNRGKGWEQAYAATIAASQLLMLIEYASFDMQKAIGNGVTNKTDDGSTSMTEITGATVNLGNASGSVTNANGYNIVSYRGEENIWGNIWAWIDGMNEENPATLPRAILERFMLRIMALLMIAKQAPIKIPEFTPIMAAVIFPLSAIRKNSIGCSLRLNTQAIPPFPLVITIGIKIPAGGLLYWAVGGLTVLMRVLSIGICVVLLLIVIGISAGGWCMYLPKRKPLNTVEQTLNN